MCCDYSIKLWNLEDPSLTKRIQQRATVADRNLDSVVVSSAGAIVDCIPIFSTAAIHDDYVGEYEGMLRLGDVEVSHMQYMVI